MQIYSTAATLNCDKFEHCKGISGHFNFAIRHLWLLYDPQTLKLWSLANMMSYLRLFKTDFYITWSHMIAYANYRCTCSLLSYHRQNGSCIFTEFLQWGYVWQRSFDVSSHCQFGRLLSSVFRLTAKTKHISSALKWPTESSHIFAPCPYLIMVQ